MSEPEFDDLLNEGEPMDDQSTPCLVNIAVRAMVKAAYWQGFSEGQTITIAYLKNRLNKAEYHDQKDPGYENP